MNDAGISKEAMIFRDLPFMGVIYVVVEAMKLGYSPDDSAWVNLGQGQPEVGPMAGAPPRMDHVPVLASDYAYGPVEGLIELRKAVAEHYNRLYRRGKASQYTHENVVIASGGRLMLTRVFATLDEVQMGYFIPDYTAYEDLFHAFLRVKPYRIELRPEDGWAIEPQRLRQLVRDARLQGLLISNPCNPTGRVIQGQELAEWVSLAREEKCTLLLDEYYSHFIYAQAPGQTDRPVSSAEWVEDVNRDPVVIIDGLTKNFRYPGWRMGWAVGPKDLMRRITAAGSFVDGGPSRPIQRAAIQILEPERADQETHALRANFHRKRDELVKTLKGLGVTFPLEPQGTFYAFGSVKDLPAPLNDGMSFFREALKHKVMTVPGAFFDVNPHKQRQGPSSLHAYVRFSFGPPYPAMVQGLGQLGKMIRP